MIDTADWIVMSVNVACCVGWLLSLRAARKKENALRNSEPAWKRQARKNLTSLADECTRCVRDSTNWDSADKAKSRLDQVLEELRMLDEDDPLANEIDVLVRRTEKVRPK